MAEEELSLHGTHSGPEGANAVSESPPRAQALQKLDAAPYPIGLVGADAIAKAMKPTVTPMGSTHAPTVGGWMRQVEFEIAKGRRGLASYPS